MNATVGARAARVLVTRPADQAGRLVEALRGAGLEPVAVPTIAVEQAPAGGQLDHLAGRLDRYDWIVVTSANGARAILAAAIRVAASLERPRWAAVGRASAAILETSGVRVSFQPQAATAAALGSELPARLGDRLLVVRGDLADERLPAALRARGAIVDDIVGYRTVEAPAESGPLLREAVANGGLDAIVLTSGSTARGLLALADAAGITAWAIPAICIGPETAAEAARLGFTVLAVAPDARADALATTTAAAVAGLRLETR